MSVATLKGIEQFTEYPIQNRNSGISLVLAPEKTIFEKFTCDLFLFCLEKMDFMFTVYYLNLIEKNQMNIAKMTMKWLSDSEAVQ